MNDCLHFKTPNRCDLFPGGKITPAVCASCDGQGSAIKELQITITGGQDGKQCAHLGEVVGKTCCNLIYKCFQPKGATPAGRTTLARCAACEWFEQQS